MPSNINVVLFLIMLLLQVADWYTTHRLLSTGGKEFNPVLLWLFKISPLNNLQSLAVSKVVVIAVSVWMVFVFTPFTYAIFCLIYTGAAMWNFYQLVEY